MATEVKIPSMGESITSGILASWRVKDGDIVEKNQILFELETDKITSEGTAEVAGKITLRAATGDEVAIGQVVAVIDETVSASAPAATPAAPAQAAASSQEHPASPAVRRIAEETGVSPSSVTGTGKDGRVTKGDMLAAADKSAAPASSPAPAPVSATPAKPAATAPEGRVSRVRMTPLRRKIAERLVSVQQESAILTTFNEVDMSGVMALRKKYQDDFVARHGVKIGFMSFFIKATVKALKEVPALNGRIEGEEIIQNHYYDIGVAVGTDKGLMVPVLRDCDQLSFAGIEKELGVFAKKAREGKIQISDLEGGVFTISNGGVYGSLLSTPIINPPQSGILGMHSIQERPVAVNGQVVIRPMMYLALSYDHRIVDGKEAVTFLVKIKQAIEDPERLLLEI
jgi:2-oxoglutarate dehydrogenase E2 component (dihydrolipoamide succinyltransferase)